jgi:acyl dehydratase
MSVHVRQRDTTSEPTSGSFFEDFQVGQRLAVTRPGAAAPGEQTAGGTLPAGLTALFACASGAGVLPSSLVRVLGTSWRDVSPSPAGGSVEVTFTVTSRRPVPGESVGAVQWHAQVRDGDGRTVQEGSIEVVLPARAGSDVVVDAAGLAFCSRPWGEELARRLADDEDFRSATATWDGTIGLRAPRDQVHLRVYRGRVIEVAGRTPLGATFTLDGPERLWTELLTGPSNDFFRRAMSGDSFTVTGNAHEYLRMSRALIALVDAARELATGARA